ncbi:hypothetical protein BDV96DRAFT_94922 [Lophiotrema nucula]|uniref:Zn(2)-C6 fungal-type domain-containing protein n=1 Tax=Lophiotrema nucula TaxID=690887 RepID=A0A6A5Z5M5_9PLEO|nr:hypothetical protein BDV96DRAFT_94922 [Lophiotrema nucula]
MLRRSHKKSKGGCTQCKRRHVKCDEARPICRLCANSDRDCSFANESNASQYSTIQKASGEHSGSSRLHTYPETASSASTTPLTVTSVTSSPDHTSPGRPATTCHDDPSVEEAVNLNHMELIIHATLHKEELFNLGDPIDDYHAFLELSLGLHTSLKYPYLLHQLLAFSARHLAYLHPERSNHYIHQAMSLQTRAISLFKAEWTDVNHSNCVAILLFSTVIGHHLLAETLSKRDPGGLDAFLTHFIQCIETQRGMYIIAKEAWPLLMESELKPVLSSSLNFTSREPIGTHCFDIKQLLRSANGLSEEERQACDLAINYLQIGLDAVLAEPSGLSPKQAYRYQMIFNWTMLAAPEFTVLLATKRPEALVVLAYYAVLLHHGRSMWQVGDAGPYILGLVSESLGSEWQSWLEYPRSMIVGSSAATTIT